MVKHQDNDECTVEVQHLTCFTSDRNEVAYNGMGEKMRDLPQALAIM
jgi:hypothetical protein